MRNPRIGAGRAFARLGIGAVWGAGMVALVWFSGLLGIGLADLIAGPDGAVAGLAVGAALAILVCRRSRRWIQWLRLRRMGCHATATVHRLDRYQTTGRAPNRTIYTVWFSWTDADGTPWLRERQYGFFASGLREFEVRLADGTEIPIRYRAGHPDRFIADIPYSATMADQLI